MNYTTFNPTEIFKYRVTKCYQIPENVESDISVEQLDI